MKARSRAAALSGQKDSAEVVGASVWDASGRCSRTGRKPLVDPEHAREIIELIWQENASGPPRRSWRVPGGQRNIWVTLLSLLPRRPGFRIEESGNGWMDRILNDRILDFNK